MTSGVIIILAECTQLHERCFDEALLTRAWKQCSTTLQRLSLSHTRASEYLQSLRILRDRALLTYRNDPDEPGQNIAPLPTDDAGHPSDITQEDMQLNANSAWGAGFLEHDWGVPFFLENWEEVGMEGFSSASSVLGLNKYLGPCENV